MNTASLKQDYQERIVPILMKEFNYTTVMQCPKLQKIVLNQGLGEAVADKKIIEVALKEMTAIAGQKAVATLSTTNVRVLRATRACCSPTYSRLQRNQ
mgnify:CR=1 FL=1